MSDSQNNGPNPDLDDNLNVAATHAVIESATPATIRERRLDEGGREPVPLSLFLVAAIALLVGGAVIGQGGRLFAYDNDSLWAYDWEPAGEGDKDEITEGPAKEFYVQAGFKVYSKCKGCHQSDGAGDGANFPPLKDSEWVIGDNTQALGMIILNGLQGPIEVLGREWNSLMPAQELTSAKDLAVLMTYLRSGLNDVGDVVSIEQAQAALDAYQERGKGKLVTQEELKTNHMKFLPGTAMAADAIVNFESYLPVETE